MKINTNSWHYRLLKKTGCNKMPKDLCGYFWALIGRAMMGIVILLALFLFTTLTVVTKGGFLLAAVGIGGITFGIGIFCIKFTEGNSVFFSWLRAKKQKICPLIEYVDEKK